MFLFLFVMFSRKTYVTDFKNSYSKKAKASNNNKIIHKLCSTILLIDHLRIIYCKVSKSLFKIINFRM